MTPAVLSLRELSSAWFTNLAEWKLRTRSTSRCGSAAREPGVGLDRPRLARGAVSHRGAGAPGPGILLTRIRSIVVPLVCLMFVCGLAPSLLANATPSGHRAILSEVPFVVFAAVALRCTWPANREAWRTVPGKLKAMLGAALTTWAFVAGLRYFHVELWKDPRALHEAHNIEQSMRAERVLRDAPRYDMRGSAPFGSEHLYFEGKVPFGPFGFAYWLPPNWAERPLSVQAVTSELPLLGLVTSAFPAGNWETPPMCWAFRRVGAIHTDGLKIGTETRRSACGAPLAGSRERDVPLPGRVDVTCAGARLIYATPLGRQSVDGRGSIKVLGGLGWVAIERAGPGIATPPVVQVRYAPEQGPTESTPSAPPTCTRCRFVDGSEARWTWKRPVAHLLHPCRRRLSRRSSPPWTSQTRRCSQITRGPGSTAPEFGFRRDSIPCDWSPIRLVSFA